MIQKNNSDVLRDMEVSSFGKILASLCRHLSGIETAVFHDSVGETIDYYSNTDPFLTRMAGAQMGIIFRTVGIKCKWLSLGGVMRVDTFFNKRECITALVGDDTFITVIAKPGILGTDLFEQILSDVLIALRKEAGY